jgi:ABC-type branched-subunit amino acid transport system ATPase component
MPDPFNSGASLSVENLVSGYSGSRVISGLQFSVACGEIVAVIGRNGAGKTTLFRTLMGLLPAAEGAIILDDQAISLLPTELRARKGMGYVPQGRGMFLGLSVSENLLMGELMNPGSARLNYAIVEECFPVLSERRGQVAESLSGGQQQMLAIARTIVGGARLLLLDEPSEGIQPSVVLRLSDILLRLNRDYGITIVFAEQNLSLIRRLARRCVVLEKGSVIADVAIDEVSDIDLQRFLSL